MPKPFLVVPYALTASGAQVLLARVQYIQTWAAGKRKTPATIPGHAGQWVLIEGETSSAEPVMPAAYEFFRGTTGIDLADKGPWTTYRLLAAVPVALEDKKYKGFAALYLRTDEAGLAALANDINGNIQDLAIENGVFSQVASVTAAAAEVGPIDPPPHGWPGFIKANYYGGAQPQQMDTVFPTVVRQIGTRSKQSGERYRVALKALSERTAPALRAGAPAAAPGEISKGNGDAAGPPASASTTGPQAARGLLSAAGPPPAESSVDQLLVEEMARISDTRIS